MRAFFCKILAQVLKLTGKFGILIISYMQKIHRCTVTLKDNKLKVLAASKEDLTLEIWTFDDKSTFFEEVFGIEPILERVNK